MRFTILSMCVATMLPTTLLLAQNDNQLPKQKVAASQAATQTDSILATWLHIGSTNEVALAQLAVKQAQSPEVRAFAQKMIDDHTAWSTKLQPLTNASGTGAAQDASGERRKAEQEETQRPKAKQPTEGSSQRSDTSGDGFDHAALIRELGKKCLQSDTKMLSGKSGADFDRCYMGMQVASHVRCNDMIEVFKGHASPNLLPILEAGQKTVAAHLEHAKSLCDKVCEVAAGDDGAGGKSPRGGR